MMAADASIMIHAIDYKAWTFWFTIVQSISFAILAVYVWISNKHKANKDAIEVIKDEFGKKLNKIDDRVIQVETTVKHLPNHEDIAALNPHG